MRPFLISACLLSTRTLATPAAADNWDNHGDVRPGSDFEKMCRRSDKPIAGLLQDLKQRGLLDETVVYWTTEFGRTPYSQGSHGRDHNGNTFVSWLAGWR